MHPVNTLYSPCKMYIVPLWTSYNIAIPLNLKMCVISYLFWFDSGSVCRRRRCFWSTSLQLSVSMCSGVYFHQCFQDKRCAVFSYRARLRKLVHRTLWPGKGDVWTKGWGCMLDEIKARSLFLSRPPTLALGRWRGSFDEFLQRPTSLACDVFFSSGEQRFPRF